MSKRKAEEPCDDEPPSKRKMSIREEVEAFAPTDDRPGMDEDICIHFDNDRVLVPVPRMLTNSMSLVFAIGGGHLLRQPDGSVVADRPITLDEIDAVLDVRFTDYPEIVRLMNESPLPHSTNERDKLSCAASMIVRMTTFMATLAKWDYSRVIVKVGNATFHLPRRTLEASTFFEILFNMDPDRDFVEDPLCIDRCPLLFKKVLAIMRGGGTVTDSTLVVEECMYYQVKCMATTRALIESSQKTIVPLMLVCSHIPGEYNEVFHGVARAEDNSAFLALKEVLGASVQKGLAMAVEKDYLWMANQFVAHGASLTTCPLKEGKCTMLCHAILHGAEKIAAMMINLGHPPQCKHSHFVWAASAGMLECMKTLILYTHKETHDNNGDTALLAALINNRASCVEWLLANGANTNAERTDRKFVYGALGIALFHPECTRVFLNHIRSMSTWKNRLRESMASVPITHIEESTAITLYKMLLDEGADINHGTDGASSAIKYASFHGRPALVQALLDLGARPTFPSKVDEDSDKYIQCIDILIKAGADCNICDNKGGTFLVNAITSGHTTIVRHLVTVHHADVLACGMDSKGHLMVSALAAAVWQNDPSTVDLFMDHCKPDNHHEQILSVAIRKGYGPIVDILAKNGWRHHSLLPFTTTRQKARFADIDGLPPVCKDAEQFALLHGSYLLADDLERVKWLVTHQGEKTDLSWLGAQACLLDATNCLLWILSMEGATDEMVPMDRRMSASGQLWVRLFYKLRKDGLSVKLAAAKMNSSWAQWHHAFAVKMADGFTDVISADTADAEMAKGSRML